MPQPPLTDEQMREAYAQVQKYGTPRAAARALQMPYMTFYHRYASAMSRLNLPHATRNEWVHPAHTHIEITNNRILIGGDKHTWPGQKTIIWKAFAEAAIYYKPRAIILNGDMFDGARVSRHGRTRGQAAPKLIDEIKAMQDHLKDLPSATHRHYVVGNHDIRLDNYLANQAPEMEDMAFSMQDYFPDWSFSWAVTVNDGVTGGHTEIRHRFRGGIHARWNNTLNSGVHMVTSHTHQLGITPFDDRNGRRYGVECGMLTLPELPQFEYGEGAPARHCPGFALLSFDKHGRLLPPQIAEYLYGEVHLNGMVWGHGKPRISLASAA